MIHGTKNTYHEMFKGQIVVMQYKAVVYRRAPFCENKWRPNLVASEEHEFNSPEASSKCNLDSRPAICQPMSRF